MNKAFSGDSKTRVLDARRLTRYCAQVTTGTTTTRAIDTTPRAQLRHFNNVRTCPHINRQRTNRAEDVRDEIRPRFDTRSHTNRLHNY
jgi:hypothetical protein